jgi:hypothetical protein
MAPDEQMTIHERDKYLRMMQKRYGKAENKKEKSKLLDEMEAVTGNHRKQLIRKMKQPIERRTRSRERGKTYGPDVQAAVSVIAESVDWLCAERLTPNLGWLADHLAAHGELVLTPSVREKLDAISIATVGRVLRDRPRDRPRLPQRGPRRANRLARDIPATRIPWDEPEPGHFEVDLVHHAGPSASGLYIHSLQLIDVATGWSERVAVLGRSALVMEDGFKRSLARLPFAVKELHPDNGSEFLNDHLIRFFGETVTGAKLSRSRAWVKNDNRFVEQKNDTLIRAYLGHDRLDTVDQTNLLNQLYDHLWLFYNFFQPVMRLQEKVILPAVDGHFPRVKRRFDDARTPFDRLCATDALSAAQQTHWRAIRDQTNLCQLRLLIYDLIDQLFVLPLSQPDERQNVYLTLFDPPDSMKGDVASSVTLSNERTITLR